MSGPFREERGELILDVLVVPRASRNRIGPLVGDRIKVQLAAPPVDGAANSALRDLLAKELGVPRSQVAVVRGETGRRKTVRVVGARGSDLERILVDE